MHPSLLATASPAHALQRDAAASAAALQAQQVQMHGQNVPWSSAGALALAALLVGVQWHTVSHGPLLAWLACLLVVMGWRGGLWFWQRRKPPAGPALAGWVLRYRINFAAHGLVWGAASALPMPAGEPMQLAMLVMMLAGICASNFILNAHDLWSALLFGVPMMLALALRLLLAGDSTQLPMGLAVLLALGYFTLIGRRAHRMVRENTLLRLAESRQNHLLRVLINTTSEGFWFIDNQAITIDANPAMCQMLGVRQADLVGRSIFEFVDAENRAVFEREIVRRAAGSSSGYEISLRRADGSTLHCFNQATPLVDDQGVRVGSVGLWTDISEQKRSEHALQQAGEALRQKTQVLADTLDSLGQGVLHWDADGRLLAHNQRVLELLELPASLFHADTRQADVASFLVARGDLRDGQELFDDSGERLPMPGMPGQLPDLYVRRTPAGLLLEVRTRSLPDGRRVRTFSDVTAYIQALRSLAAREREQRDLLEAFPGYIIVTEHTHRYTYVNQRFAWLVGRPREQIVGQHAADVLGPAAFAEIDHALDGIHPGEPLTIERVYPATDWRPRMVLQVTHAISQDPATGQSRVFAFAIDITARKEAEAALVAARDEAERANRAKSQFLSSMSHELRTPLNAILGFGHLLASDTRQPLTPTQRRQMDEILRGGHHLLQLISEVLDLAVVESGSLPIHPQPVVLAPLLADTLALLQPLAGTREVALPAAATGLVPGASVRADPVRLKQVLLNLLGNAIKYNRPGGCVQVRCEALGEADGRIWRITVQDTGLGLDAAQQARLFEAFDRLGAEAGAVEGTGLGLALSRGLVRAMGGDIGVHSDPGVGSSFWLQLPAEAAGAQAAVVPPAAAPALPPPAGVSAAAGLPGAAANGLPVVLCVEDNPVNRMLMEAVCEPLHGLQLRMAETGAEGLRMALEQPPRLVLLDIQLPDLDGLMLLQQMRCHAALAEVPVIAISADATPAVIDQCLAAGFADYLTKPVDLDRLTAMLKAALLRR